MLLVQSNMCNAKQLFALRIFSEKSTFVHQTGTLKIIPNLILNLTLIKIKAQKYQCT
jgi:hypothetical protein